MNLYTVCEKENLNVEDVEVGKAKGSKSGVVIDAGSKRYVMFPDEASAKRYAIRINKDSFDDDSEKKLDAYIGWVQRILAKYQGYVLQVSIGDKGSYLNISFGALLTHEDEVARALTAVMELKSLPEELSFIENVQIGVTRGNVRAGAYGATTRQTFGVQGKEVNIAAKIMSQAGPHQVLTSQRIMEQASSRFEFWEKQPISIKGIDMPFHRHDYLSMIKHDCQFYLFPECSCYYNYLTNDDHHNEAFCLKKQ